MIKFNDKTTEYNATTVHTWNRDNNIGTNANYGNYRWLMDILSSRLFYSVWNLFNGSGFSDGVRFYRSGGPSPIHYITDIDILQTEIVKKINLKFKPASTSYQHGIDAVMKIFEIEE